LHRYRTDLGAHEMIAAVGVVSIGKDLVGQRQGTHIGAALCNASCDSGPRSLLS